MWVYEPHYDGLASLRLKDDTGITFRCMARYQCPENETCGSITPNNAYVSGYTPSCPAPYFKETFYWNNAYTRCVNDNLEGETPTPGLPPCEPWENTGWYKVTSSFDQNTCAARGAAVQDCKYSNGATAQFCDLSTDCGIGGNYNSYYDYRYCPNGAECVYRDCRYGVTVAFEIPQQITNKQCFACWQYTNDGCGSENHYIRCK